MHCRGSAIGGIMIPSSQEAPSFLDNAVAGRRVPFAFPKRLHFLFYRRRSSAGISVLHRTERSCGLRSGGSTTISPTVDVHLSSSIVLENAVTVAYPGSYL